MVFFFLVAFSLNRIIFLPKPSKVFFQNLRVAWKSDTDLPFFEKCGAYDKNLHNLECSSYDLSIFECLCFTYVPFNKNICFICKKKCYSSKNLIYPFLKLNTN